MKRRVWLLRGLTILLASIVALIVCEILLRTLAFGPESVDIRDDIRLSADSELGYELIPGAKSEEDDIPISSAGLRDREFLETPPTDTFRIAMIGDSVTFGTGVPGHDTMAKVLERLLNESRLGGASRFEVLNFGVPGYNSRQIARRLEIAVARFDPALVVYVYCLNDPVDAGDELEHVLAGLDPSGRRSFGSVVRRASAVFHGSRLYQVSVVTMDLLYDAGWNDLPLPGFVTRPDRYYVALHGDPTRWNRFKGDLSRMVSTAQNLNAGFIGLISPHLWEDERRDSVNPLLGSVSSKVAEAFLSQGAKVFDLTAPVARFSQATGQYVGMDQLHFAAAGHRLAAVALLDVLLRDSLLPDVVVRGVSSLPLEGEWRLMSQALR